MFEIKENEILYRLGKNAKENHLLIDDADKNDWWFHLDNLPSGHCIVEKTEELQISEIIFAANLVKNNSKYKNNRNLKVCYTQVKNIKKGKNPGQVILLKEPSVINL